MPDIISLEQNAKIVFEKAAALILKYTVLLYIEENGPIKPFASGVLYSDGKNFYLITAAHCLKQKGKQLIKIGIIDQGSFHLIGGEIALRLDESAKIDIAVVKLTSDSAQACLRNYKTLTRWQVALNGTESGILDYLIVGYPVSKTSVNRKQIKSEPLVFVSRSKDNKLYTRLGYTLQNHRILAYSKRQSAYMGENIKNMAPDPAGISGCGYWHVPSLFVDDITEDSFKLCGIMFEFHGRHNYMLANNIELVLDLIEKLNIIGKV